MTEYKGYRIATTVPNFWTSAAMANYRVDRKNLRGWQRAHEGTVRGSFTNLDDAHSAADAAAHRWIDQQAFCVAQVTRNGVMPPAKTEWVFSCSADRTWAWRAIPRDGGEGETAGALISLEAATADATKHGFDAFSEYWIVRIDGRTTHYRPGQTPANLTSDYDPPS